MAEGSTKRIRVTGQERAHPALRRLARACIALARLQLTTPKPANKPSAAETGQAIRASEPGGQR